VLFRSGRKGLAALTLVCDALKGTFAVLIAFYFGGQDLAVLAALGAFLGHLFPVWLKFNGGKGVATFIGLLIAFAWLATWRPLVAFGVVWLAVAVLTRYSSLAGLLASIASVLFFWWDGYLQEAQLFALLTVLIWAKHHHNIARLVAGTESKIGR